MEDEKISKQLLSINDLLREIEISNVNSLELVLEKTNCIREMIDELIDKKIWRREDTNVRFN